MSANASYGRYLYLSLGIMAFVSLLAVPVAAGSLRPACTIGFVPNWGEQVRYEQGKPTGPLVVASSEILDRAGIAFSFRYVVSTRRLMRDFMDGKVDILVAMDGMVPFAGTSAQSDAFLEEYLVTIRPDGKIGKGAIAINSTVSRLLATEHFSPSPHRILVESLSRRARLLADGKADAIQDAVSNIMGLQIYAGANSPLVIDRLLKIVPIRYFFSQNIQCDYQTEDINLSINTWLFDGGMVRLRNASWAQAIKN